MESAADGASPPDAGGDGKNRPDGVTGRTGRNLPAAIAVGLGLGALVIGSLYVFKVLFLVVAAVAVGIGVTELVRAFATRGIHVPLVPVLAGLALMVAGAYWGGPAGLVGGFAVTLFTLLVWRMFRRGDGESGGHVTDGYVRDASASVLVAAYPAFLAGFVGLLLEPADGPHRVVIFVAVTVASDIGGYAAGVLFGRHRMAPVISPKKTWEGFAGSALTCVVVGAWLVTWLLDGELWQGALLGAVFVVFATAGDLVESVIKRDLRIKDLGTLLPGHGGMMDRLDSLVVTLVPAWVLLELFAR
ncbi:phosphatidate cytidylyltransferase [Spongiactinospora sp. TRM90649]|uniref:phosphatidate cytidylyltransferase n=1 Tax=Spongiactinospora sp. TRM90649 TaxID=3031114 RepID=UPI0023F9D059|nr:phosphatidate cytidylyltransferase [Spongiactinospora sp. TRM90649]MDF5752727.1 phosphatidate cytidylyltransferase [Spongiactinospora sp. TRM90649]